MGETRNTLRNVNPSEGTRLSASVVPFPACRRLRFIVRHAERMAQLSPCAAERHLNNQLRILGDALLRKGVDAAVIDGEMRSLAQAIRNALSTVLLGEVG